MCFRIFPLLDTKRIFPRQKKMTVEKKSYISNTAT